MKTLFAILVLIGINYQCFSQNSFEELNKMWGLKSRSIDAFINNSNNKIIKNENHITIIEQSYVDAKNCEKIVYLFTDNVLTVYTIFFKENCLDDFLQKYGAC